MLLWWSFMQWLAGSNTVPPATPGSLCDSATVAYENRVFMVPGEVRSFRVVESRTLAVLAEDRTFAVGCGDC